MVHLQEVERQLKQIGYNFHFWYRAERRELANILLPDEKIKHCANGQYEGGFAILCVTDQRILLIDRKPMYLTLEDIRFDMVTEIDYRHRLINASIHVTTPNRTLVFVGYNHALLRKLLNYTQQRLMEMRQQQYMYQQFQQPAPASQEPQRQQYLRQDAPQPSALPINLAYEAGGNEAQFIRIGRPAVNPYTAVPLFTRHRISKYSR